ncbi:DUF7673 family protein [Pseudomonas agarici]|uniref:DUF7673 family protein n=1 Tax=Pseudomonas agarici TaxID=46677 RepID=UPI0015A3CE7A|nr:hypothetical protein [Pseudomonas agarici]NWB91632.1 hypothetical protein [Pseudomonas agarici]
MPNYTEKNVFNELFKYQAERPAIRAIGIDALLRLIPVTQRNTGQSAVVGRFLLGLYNGYDHPFNLTELRALDAGLFDDCIAVLRLDNSPEQEVHTYINNGDAIWQELRRNWA